MTQDVNNLRDARLKKALSHAPDAQDMPARNIRDAIKNKANDAISTGYRTRFDTNPPWWKRFWASTGRASSPWNAAFATVLLGSIITLIWHGQDVPDAALEERPVTSPRLQGEAQPAATAPLAVTVPAPSVPTTVPAPVPAQPPLAKSIPAPKPEKSPQASPKASDKAKTEPLEERRKEDSGTSGKTESSMEQVAPSATARAPAPMPPPQPLAPAPAPAPAIAAAAPPQALGQAGVLADRARSNAKTPAASPSMAAAPPPQWDSLEVVYRGRATKFSKADSQSQSLMAQVQALVQGSDLTISAPPISASPTLMRLQWRSEGSANTGAVATFELWEGRFRWRQEGRDDVVGVPRGDLLEALIASVSRLLPP
jgi:hypothetical protein